MEASQASTFSEIYASAFVHFDLPALLRMPASTLVH
jgi:hypothetical protein